MSVFLRELAQKRASDGLCGIYSICSAHPWVLEAAIRSAQPGPLLIEATCNQVNQFGGYTGLNPGNFRDLVHGIAARAGFPAERILLGGDHLGPFPWQHLDAETAMGHACDMVAQYVRDGYCKIHLDASMPCADDPRPLPGELIAARAARLCMAAESEAGRLQTQPVYVIGTEVPTPGGAGEETGLTVTSPEDAEAALRLHREAFVSAGLAAAWPRVIALVVQPGVEFRNESVTDYAPTLAAPLAAMLNQHEGIIFEAHSTDYQMPQALAAMVRDGFRILKVGPGLTHAMRRALFALAAIEDELLAPERRSHLRTQIDAVMLEHPEPWQKHYGGTPDEQQRLRQYSYSDRVRYYWTDARVQQAVQTLLANLATAGIPETLLSDSLPAQYARVRAGLLHPHPHQLILDAIAEALLPYQAACASL